MVLDDKLKEACDHLYYMHGFWCTADDAECVYQKTAVVLNNGIEYEHYYPMCTYLEKSIKEK